MILSRQKFPWKGKRDPCNPRNRSRTPRSGWWNPPILQVGFSHPRGAQNNSSSQVFPLSRGVVVTVRFNPKFSHHGATQLLWNFVKGGSGKRGRSWDRSSKAQRDPASHLNSDFLGSAFATSFPPCHCWDNLGKAPAELSFSTWTLGIIAKPLSLTRCFRIPREKAPWNCRAPGFWGVWRFIGCQIQALPRKMKCWRTWGWGGFQVFPPF